tara:strand:+ start:690 stop:935 length:246 start_codon:yes stop_codon:yes gene_type:complete
MEVILFVGVAFYSIFLNLRVKDLEEELIDIEMKVEGLELKVYNKMMEMRRDIKDSLKIKTIEKSRRRSTKRSRKVSPTEVS